MKLILYFSSLERLGNYQLSGYNSFVRVCVNATQCTVCETAVHIQKFLMQRGLFRHAPLYINGTVGVSFITPQMILSRHHRGVSPHMPRHYQRNCPLWRCSLIGRLFFIFSQISTYICGPYQISTIIIIIQLQRLLFHMFLKPRC